MSTADEQKRAVGVAAAALIEDGMTVGLGSGSTAAFFVEALAARKLGITCVSTSEVTAAQAKSLGMTVISIDDAGPIDLTIDGADEIGPGLDVIKGGGAALLREKLVWEASRRRVVIADASKTSAALGRYPLPIEVIAFGHLGTLARIVGVLKSQRLPIEPVLSDGESRGAAAYRWRQRTSTTCRLRDYRRSGLALGSSAQGR